MADGVKSALLHRKAHSSALYEEITLDQGHFHVNTGMPQWVDYDFLIPFPALVPFSFNKEPDFLHIYTVWISVELRVLSGTNHSFYLLYVLLPLWSWTPGTSAFMFSAILRTLGIHARDANLWFP